ncbi:hypothetical protein WUBG_15455 [Wuchereria bancrofti]|uniref:Uncharacterized protein n=1 Tax=Wuchereria bancrofti TaxID=6293 RepID=J9DVG0_WUCBA|nr:hypothetical protein WUBG_15455 [Wuchereria bancrofti]
MYSLLILLLPFVSLSLTDKCDSSAYKLATFALSNGNNNALERLKCSTEHYDIDFKIIVLGKRKSLIRRHCFSSSPKKGDIVCLIQERRFDAIVTSDESDIICQFLNACSNCRALLTSNTVSAQRYY